MNSKKTKNSVRKKIILSIVIAMTITTAAGCGKLSVSDGTQPNMENNNQATKEVVKNKDSVDSEKEAKVKKLETKKEEEKGESTKAAVKVEGDAKPSMEATTNPVKPKEATAKPTIIPQTLSEDQLYAAYNNTLIIGDSRTEGFKLYSGVKNASYFCMKAMTIDKIVDGKTANIDGSTLSVYDLLDAGSYDKIIVGVGLNELGWNHIETFLKDYEILIDKIKEKQPDAVIYLQAVLPVSREKNASDKVHNNAQVFWYNENIIALAENKGVQYVNPAGALVDEEGFLVNEATTDGIHLNSTYCKLWAEYLAQLIK